MTIIYLDQNAASYLARPKAGSEWELLRSTIVDGFQERRIICPFPMETIFESAPCDLATRTAIEAIFRSVSGGTRFRAFSELLVDETLALVRTDHEVVAFELMGGGWAANNKAANNTREFRKRINGRMINRMQACTFRSSPEEMTAEQICHGSFLERCGMFWRDLQKFSGNSSTPVNNYEISWLMSGLISHQLTTREAQQLLGEVQCHRWESIPVNFFDLILGSRWDHDSIHPKGRKYQPNDEVDRWRATVALTHSDLFITDSYTVELCRRSRVGCHTPTIIFSTKQISEIIKYVRECT